jgi:ribosome-binding factor A
VRVSADLQVARVFYTVLGDEGARKNSSRALGRAAPFLRRQIGSRLRLKRVPELSFMYDDSIEGQNRIERILNELQESGRHDAASEPPQANRNHDDEEGP